MSDVVYTVKTWLAGPQGPCCGEASEDLADRCRPRATRLVLYMLERPADHDGTIRWPFRHNFSKVVLADHRQAQMDHQGRVHAEAICSANT